MPVLFKDAFLVKFSDKAVDNKKQEMALLGQSRPSLLMIDNAPFTFED